MPAIAAALTTSSGGRASTGRSVETVARVPVLLVETDHDGTLAEVVSDPAMAVPVRESIVGLRALATLGSTHAAVISGRSLADLAALSALDAAALTIGLAGLPGREEGFFLCVSWLVDALWKVGRQADAEALFESIVELAGPEGLLPEQYDPLLGRTLGNHPQAYSLIGLIENTLIFRGLERRGEQTLGSRPGLLLTIPWGGQWYPAGIPVSQGPRACPAFFSPSSPWSSPLPSRQLPRSLPSGSSAAARS